MGVESVPEPFSGFKRLNSSTYLYEPPTTTTKLSSTGPELILLFAWLDAAPRHIAKYSRGYQKLYPGARILLVTTLLANVTIHSRAAEEARLAPALSLLSSLAPSSSSSSSPPPPPPRILLHSFSNGGAYSAHLLARLYLAQQQKQQQLPPPLPLSAFPPSTTKETASPPAPAPASAPHAPNHLQLFPISAQILDSGPAGDHYGRTVTALALGLPQRPLAVRLAGLVLLHAFLALYWVVKRVTGGRSKIEVMRVGLLDAAVWDRAVPRCYVYSRTDKMVLWQDVLQHAARSREGGWERVSVEEFEGSAHCGHFLVDERRYWAVVERVWGERVGSDRGT